MSRRPAILGERRALALALLVTLAFGQAAAMVTAAFATHDVFVALRAGGGPVPRRALVALAISGIAICLLRALEGRIGEAAGQSYAAAIRGTLFRHITRMPTSAVSKRRSGALALRFVGDLTAFKGWIARGLARLISAAVTIPAALGILYLLDPMLFGAAVGPLAAVLGGIWLISRPLGHAHATLRSKRAKLAAAMAERLPQAIALRRSGRMKAETKALTEMSAAVARAGVHREWLAATVRALPDAGSGIAGALCLWVCLHQGLGVPEAVAALTALAMVVWPLRHLADVADRRRAYLVASDKLDKLLATPRLAPAKTAAVDDAAPAISIAAAQMPGDAAFHLLLARGAHRRLTGPAGSGKSTLLLALAGLEATPKAERFDVCGAAPGSLRAGRVLYLGRRAPSLSGSLRREVTLGLGRAPDDAKIVEAVTQAGLADLLTRLGGLGGKITEARRNLTATEQARVHLARAYLARPDLVLIDADEIGLHREDLRALLDHLTGIGAATLVVTTDPEATLRLGAGIDLAPCKTPVGPHVA